MAEKYIMQNMINGVCQYPDLWPNTETDLGSFILNLPSINGDVFKVGVKKELDYIEPGEQEYIGNGIHTFTVPAGITKMNYGITAKNGISILDNTFKIGSIIIILKSSNSFKVTSFLFNPLLSFLINKK